MQNIQHSNGHATNGHQNGNHHNGNHQNGHSSSGLSVPFVDLAAQYASLQPDVDLAMQRVLSKTDFILGQDVDRFEEEFAAYCETSYAIGIDSGTSALEMVLKAYDIGPGDEVITVANTFMATVLSISYVGATPVLVDIDPMTYQIDPEQVLNAITPRTKAIMPVHLYGHPVDMDPILSMAERYGLIVIEDASQAHGARYKGKRAGSLGHAAVFSFYPAKNLGAYGDGGAVVTSDAQVNAKLRMLRNYGQREKYHHLMKGYNRRLDTLQAAVLRVKLPRLDGWNEARRQHAKRYTSLLADLDGLVTPPYQAPYAEPVYHIYLIRVKERAQLQTLLNSKKISTGIHYPVPIHLQPAYQDLGYKKGDFPITERYASEILSLPMYAELPNESIDYVADAIHEFAAQSEVHREAVAA
ncbi:MAG: DegT/DnrJ/EryC1/StrS family aminotransferase [Caldilineaceae bacterium]